jgi:transcriptional regulator of aromatic amino acid metabolism
VDPHSGTLDRLFPQEDPLGRSDGMQAVFAAVNQVANADTTVLITGETGTGKERVRKSPVYDSLANPVRIKIEVEKV